MSAIIGDLYAPDRAASRLVNAVAEYTGLPINRPPYKHFEDNQLEPFLKDFPHGKIPAFKSSKGVAIFEGVAIARYFAALAPDSGLLPTSPEDQALMDQWVHLIDTEIFNMAVTNFFICAGIVPGGTQELRNDLHKRELRALATVNNHLAKLSSSSSPSSTAPVYLLNTTKPTLADIQLATCIRFTLSHTFAKAQREAFPFVLKHFEEMVKLDGLKKYLSGAEYVEEVIQVKKKD